MRSYLLALLLIGVFLSPLWADDASQMRELRASLKILEAKVARLEQENGELKAENDRLKEQGGSGTSAAARSAAAAPVESDQWPAEWVRSFEAADRARTQKLKDIAARIEDANAKYRQADAERGITRNPARIANFAKEIRDLRTEESTLKAQQVPDVPDLDLVQMGQGSIGRVRNGLFIDCIQVIDGNEFRGAQSVSGWHATSVGGRGMLTRAPGRVRYEKSETVRFRGVDTAGMVDGKQVTSRLYGLWMAKGTTSYTTVAGAQRTEAVLEPVDAEKWAAAYTAWKKAATGGNHMSQKTSKPNGPLTPAR